MKILMVAIPNHHFFRWTNQLEQSGYEVFWFDATSNGSNSPQIPWVKQYTNWKLKWDFPFRSRLKKNLPKFYQSVNSFNIKNTNKVFDEVVQNIQPDVIHCFEMKLSIKPVFKSLLKNSHIPLIYSSWGSDMYSYKSLGLNKAEVHSYLNRVNYLIADCKRDFNIANSNGFVNEFLGVFPGNGGLTIISDNIKPLNERHIILIKGYEDGVGKAINVLKAIEELYKFEKLKLEIIIYSADYSVIDYIKTSSILSGLNIKVFSRYEFIPNETLLNYMGQSRLHIANSISDGMPNSLLEAMSMGSFPIQSNPGKVTEEVISHGVNGLLIEDPNDSSEIKKHISFALNNIELLQTAKDYNENFMLKHYNRSTLQPKIIQLYKTVLA
jgi:glycosyltransferase involved in cell wall biosynthesis